MSTATKPCACGCNPCICLQPPGTNVGCVPVSCVPRPCFFDGQLIGADDINSVVAYFRNQAAILARLVGGWGILGGLKLDAPLGAADAGKAYHLATGTLAQLSPNPQVVSGTTLTISPGVAIDALGRTLILCDEATINVQDLARSSSGGTLRAGTCADIIGPYCSAPAATLVATEFFLVAELLETPTRPAPKYSGGAPCDPAPTCEFSRKNEDVRFSLLGSIPDSYQYTGCLDATTFTLPDVLLGQETDADLCRDEVFAFIDNLQAQLAAGCCSRPGVVLGKVLLTKDPGSIAGNLASSALYTIVSDSYPCRKMTMQMGLFTKLFPNLICPAV